MKPDIPQTHRDVPVFASRLEVIEGPAVELAVLPDAPGERSNRALATSRSAQGMG